MTSWLHASMVRRRQVRRHHRNPVTIQPPIAACPARLRGCLTSGSTHVPMVVRRRAGTDVLSAWDHICLRLCSDETYWCKLYPLIALNPFAGFFIQQ
jgi:hypothetical protein